jgi:SsrA-binding protein
MAKSKIERKAEKEKPAPRGPAMDNRRARYEFEILESLEAGIALTGTEIKSLREGGGSLGEAYARVRDGEMWLVGMYIPPYKQGSFSNVDPRRPRKLLLHRTQIDRFAGRITEKGLTLVPLRLYFTRGMAKVELGLARGKKLWDKRRATAERDAKRELERAVRQ